jgi:hypothetical protein
METCPRCYEAVEPGWAYCPHCGRSRILESLRSPSREPQWHREILRGLIMGFSIWLVVTLGVAVLREAKAVRDAREFLEEGNPQRAWVVLEPFLQGHPEHEQALFLCVRANVELANPVKAGECLSGIPKLAPELAKTLGPRIEQQAAAAGCNASAFQAWFELAEKLGEEKVKEVERTLIMSVPNCSSLEEPAKIVAFLASRNRAMDMINLVFVPMIEQQANHWTARQIAQQAVQLVPESEEVVNQALERRSQGD